MVKLLIRIYIIKKKQIHKSKENNEHGSSNVDQLGLAI
jgi:hypothetical protein